MRKIIYLILLLPLTVFGQKADDIITLRIGYGSPNIVFKDAMEFEAPVKFFQNVLNTGKIFVADGAEIGISKSITNKMFTEVSFTTFSGRDNATINNKENYYTLKGFQLPVTMNYLTGDGTKRLRVNLGGGVHFLKGHLQQYEIISTGSGQTTNKLTDLKISEIQLALRPGVQFRVIPDLYVSFLANFGISKNGNISDNPSLSLKYTFKKKK